PTDRGSPLFTNLQYRVATNRAGCLSVGLSPPPKPRMLHALANFGKRSWHRGIYQPDRIFAVGGTWDAGRVLFLADHSIFINNMMLQADTGNVGFTYNCLDWLSAGGDERRNRVLLYDGGKLVTDFNVPLVYPTPRMPDDPVALFDE